MRWVENVAAWKRRQMHITFWPGNLKDRELEDMDSERKILKWILQTECKRVWTGFIWLRIELN
jgi:hypothetical protein